MYAIIGIYDGAVIKPLQPVDAAPNTKVVITFLDEEDSKAPFAPTRFEDVAGCLHYKGPAKTLEEMEAAIEKGVKEQWK
ncbi:MAG: hypothetical protein NTX50_21500 [Candidatus Sumerlaeota bacterium]|nr:hypothetical protein [Candidatus Sumerlaeota bacterium]